MLCATQSNESPLFRLWFLCCTKGNCEFVIRSEFVWLGDEKTESSNCLFGWWWNELSIAHWRSLVLINLLLTHRDSFTCEIKRRPIQYWIKWHFGLGRPSSNCADNFNSSANPVQHHNHMSQPSSFRTCFRFLFDWAPGTQRVYSINSWVERRVILFTHSPQSMRQSNGFIQPVNNAQRFNSICPKYEKHSMNKWFVVWQSLVPKSMFILRLPKF